MTKQISFNRCFSKHVGQTILDINKDDTCVITTEYEGHFIEIKAGDLFHTPAAGLCIGRHRVGDILPKFLLLVVD